MIEEYGIDREFNEDVSESGLFGLTEADRLIDRKNFVHNLGVLLSQTRESIIGAYLDDNETVHVLFHGGYEQSVNVNLDSYTSIIKDVMKWGL